MINISLLKTRDTQERLPGPLLLYYINKKLGNVSRIKGKSHRKEAVFSILVHFSECNQDTRINYTTTIDNLIATPSMCKTS